ncbi:uncharacterized protein LOC126234270 [Schistocerca nitens]|uniref:uncharacterized protein LOC126234270 n=1 Tax=Schistocerca nitens TaxID=7011 RepID=UPI0021190A76|nr:uncharacterized protein LOC126234270 [Schistocerca nitens]
MAEETLRLHPHCVYVKQKTLARRETLSPPLTRPLGEYPLWWLVVVVAESRASASCPSGSADAILALVNAGANVEAEDKDGLTALHCAASRGHTDCLETLLTLCGAQVDVMDSHGCTALFYAATLGHADATRLLLGHGADPNRQDRKGRTPAHCGAAKGQLETLRLLAAHGASLWLRNVRGDLPLHDAVASGRTELVRWLLGRRPDAADVVMDHGALLNPVMRSGRGAMLTPLDAALHRGNRGVAKYLQLHGGVPAARLTDKAARLRGATQQHRGVPAARLTDKAARLRGATQQHRGVPAARLTDKAARLRGATQQHRAALSETPASEVRFSGTPECLVQPRLGASLAASPLATLHPDLPRADSRALQVRLSDDVAVRHVERLVPVCAHDHDHDHDHHCRCRGHSRRASSSDDEQRSRRRRHHHRHPHQHQRRRRRPHSPKTSCFLSVLRVLEYLPMKVSDTRNWKDIYQKYVQNAPHRSCPGRRRQKRRASGDHQGRRRQQGRSSSASGGASSGGGDEERDRRRRQRQGQARGPRGRRSASASASASPSASDSSDSARRGGRRRRRHGEQRKRAGSASEEADQGEEEAEEEEGEVGRKGEGRGAAKEPRDGRVGGGGVVDDDDDDDDDNDVQVCVGKRAAARRRGERRHGTATSGKASAPASRKTEEEKKSRTKHRELAVVKEEEVKKKTAVQSSVEARSSKKKNNSGTSASNGEASKSEAKKTNAKVRIADEEAKTLSKGISGDAERAEDTQTSSSTTVARELLKAISTEKSVTSIDDEVAPEEPPKEHLAREPLRDESPSEDQPTAEAPDEGGGLGEEASRDAEAAEPFAGLPKERTDSVYTTSLDEGATQQVVTAIVHHEPADDSERTSLQPSELEADNVPADRDEQAPAEDRQHPSEVTEDGQPADVDTSTIDKKPSIVKQEKIEDSTVKDDSNAMEEGIDGGEEVDTGADNTKGCESADQDEQSTGEKNPEEEPAENESLKGEADDDGGKSDSENNGADEKRHDVSEAGSGVVGESRKDVSRADDEVSTADAVDEEGVVADASEATAASSSRMAPSEVVDSEERVSTTEQDPASRRRRQSTMSGAAEIPSDEEAPARRESATRTSSTSTLPAKESQEESGGESEGDEGREQEELEVEDGVQKWEEGEEEAVAAAGARAAGVPRPCRQDGRPPLSTVSVTQAVQNSMRKYHMERRIFQQLLELKRLQIRAGRANEHVLVKRLVDDYRRAGLIVGLKGFHGPFTFRAFEKYLYDQLRTLQSAERRLVPRLKSSDDLEKLSAALRRAKLNNLLPPGDPALCTHGTHRCHHAAHAYTGVPCAAYIAPRLNHHQLPKTAATPFLPRIHTGAAPGGGGRPAGAAKGAATAAGRAVTLELGAGGRHVIALPAERDRDKRYYVSFTIKGGGGGAPGAVAAAAGAAPDREDGRHRHAKSL